MSDYIVCRKKRNNPRMNVRICQKKCTEKNDCKEYIAHSKTAIETENITLPAEGQAVALGAA